MIKWIEFWISQTWIWIQLFTSYLYEILDLFLNLFYTSVFSPTKWGCQSATQRLCYRIVVRHKRVYRANLFLQSCICACLLSHVWLFVTLWTVACQAPLSMEFSRQEYWSGLPFPTPGDVPDLGIEPMSHVSPALAGGFFIAAPPRKPEG